MQYVIIIYSSTKYIDSIAQLFQSEKYSCCFQISELGVLTQISRPERFAKGRRKLWIQFSSSIAEAMEENENRPFRIAKLAGVCSLSVMSKVHKYIIQF